jgi:hypothetical protein
MVQAANQFEESDVGEPTTYGIPQQFLLVLGLRINECN